MNSRLLTLFLISLGLLLGAFTFRNGDLAWMALPLLFYMGMGLLRAPDRAAIRLQATRQVQRSDPPAASIEVQVRVVNQGGELDDLLLVDPLQPGMKIMTRENSQRMSLGGGEETQLEYTLAERRGQYAWKELQAYASDPFGLVQIHFRLPAPGELSVQPSYESFRHLPLRPHSTLHAPGSIPARMGGSGIDFWGVREYHPGDSLRWLDWRLTARHPHQFFTKEFEQEEIADIGLILDARQKMDLQRDEESLFEHSVSAAASLAEGFLHQGHRVSLLALNESIQAVFPGYGKVQLSRILNSLSKIKTGSNETFNSLKHLPLRMFSSHALLIVLSPLAANDWPFFPRLRASGFQALLISPDPFDFAYQAFSQDAATQFAMRAARIERRLQLREVARLQIPVIDWLVSQPLYPLVRMAVSPLRGQPLR